MDESAIKIEAIDEENNLSGEVSTSIQKLDLGLDEDTKEQFWSETWPKLAEKGWVKQTIETPDSPERLVLATSSDLALESSTEGVDYFSTVADVVEFLKNKDEPQTEERRRRTVTKPDHFDPTFAPSIKRQRRKKSQLPESPQVTQVAQVDMAWKEGRNHFPKKSSAVGENFQATDIPEAGSYLDDKQAGSEPERIWDPVKAEEVGIHLVESDPIAKLPHNLREAALLELGRSGYDMEALETANLKPTDGSDWTQDQKDTFHSLMFRLRRDLPAVAKAMEVPITVCHTYYLNTYKQTCEYRLLKTVCIDEHETKLDHDEHEHDACAICGDGGNLLICDGCEGEFHLSCVQPRLSSIPEGHWECDECVDRRFLAARDYLLSHTKMFETLERKQRGAEGQTQITYEFKPIPQALDAARKFVDSLNETLAKN